jgi:hypothetical protein
VYVSNISQRISQPREACNCGVHQCLISNYREGHLVSFPPYSKQVGIALGSTPLSSPTLLATCKIEEKELEEEDELLLCEEPESSKEPEGEVEELEGEKKLEPPLPEQNEEEREAEYQRMIDKLNNTLSAALARGERRRRRR